MKILHFKIFLFVIFIASIQSAQVAAKNNVNQEIEHSDATKVVGHEVSNIKLAPKLNRPWVISLGTSNLLPKGYGVEYGLSYSLLIAPTWILTPRIYYTEDNSKNDPDRDYNLRSANDKDLVVIGDEFQNDSKEMGIDMLLGRRYNVTEKVVFEPYVGGGFGTGNFSEKREIKTADQSAGTSICSNGGFSSIFNNCNIYNLSTDFKYNTYKFVLGNQFIYQYEKFSLFFFAEYQLRKAQYRSRSNAQSQGSGDEGAIFPTSMYSDAEVNSNVYRLGVGMKI